MYFNIFLIIFFLLFLVLTIYLFLFSFISIDLYNGSFLFIFILFNYIALYAVVSHVFSYLILSDTCKHNVDTEMRVRVRIPTADDPDGCYSVCIVVSIVGTRNASPHSQGIGHQLMYVGSRR